MTAPERKKRHSTIKERVYVLANSVVVAKADHTHIEADHGTDYGAPLPAGTRQALAAVVHR